VIPRRHVARLEDLEVGEWRALFDTMLRVARGVARLDGVGGVNIGVNSGESAGQTVDHAHVHVIPRRDGDVPDPRGGVRWVIPERAVYWTGR
jgi:diadenosine tetraphosphate (Ap4A) HIT family hydrolase